MPAKMCCFSQPVHGVSRTNILVLPTNSKRQITLYENTLSIEGGSEDSAEDFAKNRAAIEKEQSEAKYGNAMILPAPLKRGQEIQLLDLSEDGFSFQTLRDYFPSYYESGSENDEEEDLLDKAPRKRKLSVHKVGVYFVSIAKELEDLKRIDPKVFKVSKNITELFGKHYALGFGFIICCFNPNVEVKSHPIGYVHDLMDDGKMFVPCRHEHGHGTTKTEHFDHEIYSVNTVGKECGPTKAEIYNEHPYTVPHEPVELPDSEKKGFFANIFGKKEKKVEPVKPAPEPPKVFEFDPKEAAEALESNVLKPFLPQLQSLRQRIIRGNFQNDDLIFSLM